MDKQTRRVMFSTKPVGKSEIGTPQEFFDLLKREFLFTLDAAATPKNAKVFRFFTREDNGLKQPWQNEVVFVNPPYGRGVGKWLYKAYAETRAAAASALPYLAGSSGVATRECTVALLLPARTDTAWWHSVAVLAHEIRFCKGRLKFSGRDAAAPFPSVLVVYRSTALPVGGPKFVFGYGLPTKHEQKAENEHRRIAAKANREKYAAEQASGKKKLVLKRAI